MERAHSQRWGNIASAGANRKGKERRSDGESAGPKERAPGESANAGRKSELRAEVPDYNCVGCRQGSLSHFGARDGALAGEYAMRRRQRAETSRKSA